MKNLITLLVIGAVMMKLLNALDENLTPGGSPIRFETSYDTALSRARSSGKPLVVIFSASWCPPCKQMKEKVYPSEEVAPYRSNFVWAYLDVDLPSNQAAAQAFGARGIPHIAFLDSQGTPIGTTGGGMPAQAFADQLKSALASAH